MEKNIRSRILEFFSKECLNELYSICKTRKIRDNNTKVDLVRQVLNKYKLIYDELGPGTNRYAILLDGYVIKIALDRWGIQDNLNELTISEELQPFVSKTYETNQLLLVAEYVTVMSKDDFEKYENEIKRILALVTEGYLVGDVGLEKKNFCNWGLRDNGQIVMLDYAYIYKIRGDELLCPTVISEETGAICGELLQYNSTFTGLYCPRCAQRYSFTDVRRQIPVEHEKAENEAAMAESYMVTQPLTIFNEEEVDEEDDQEEETHMVMRRNSSLEKLYKMFEEDVPSLPDDMNVDDLINANNGENEISEEDALMRAVNAMNTTGEKYETETDEIARISSTIPGVEDVEVEKEKEDYFDYETPDGFDLMKASRSSEDVANDYLNKASMLLHQYNESQDNQQANKDTAIVDEVVVTEIITEEPIAVDEEFDVIDEETIKNLQENMSTPNDTEDIYKYADGDKVETKYNNVTMSEEGNPQMTIKGYVIEDKIDDTLNDIEDFDMAEAIKNANK